MTYEQDNSLTAYRLGAIVLGVAIVVVTICGSLGLVWMRQQVSGMATNASRLQTQIAESERFSAGLQARLARALSPQYLSSRLPQGLRPSASEQIVWSARPQQLSPVAGFGDGTMIASATVPPSQASGGMAAAIAGAAHATAAATVATTASAVAAVSTAGSGNSLVETPQAARAAAQRTDASASVTFDLALLGDQARSGAAVRR